MRKRAQLRLTKQNGGPVAAVTRVAADTSITPHFAHSLTVHANEAFIRRRKCNRNGFLASEQAATARALQEQATRRREKSTRKELGSAVSLTVV